MCPQKFASKRWGCAVRTFSVGLAVLLGAAMVFMAGAGFAADYLAFLWPAELGKRNDDFRYGYIAGVIDSVTYTQAASVPGSRLTAAYTCVRSTKGLNALNVLQAVTAQLGPNPQDTDAVSAAVITVLEACKFPAQAGGGNTMGKNKISNTLHRRP